MEAEVRKQLQLIKESKAGGPDDIPAIVLKQCNQVLAYPLMLLYNKSLTEAKLPQDWKDAIILPIYKSGEKLHCNNYRPISLTSIVIKLMEKILFLKISAHVESNNLLDEEQFGFRKGKSCELQLLLYTKYISKCVDEKVPVYSIYLDLQKAFDKVPHTELLNKLEFGFGINNNLMQWLRAFFTNRRQKVRVGKAFSDWATVTSGVPQGSVLAPLLFILYVRDMHVNLNSVNVLKFADDTKLFLAIQNSTDEQILQSSLDNLSKWLDTWKMPINVNKCCVLCFSATRNEPKYYLYNELIKNMPTERDLGLNIHYSLSSKQHIQAIVNKALKLYGWLVRILCTKNPQVKIRLYKAIIRPVLEYGSTVWSPCRLQQIDYLEKVQRKYTKFALNWSTYTYQERLKLLELPTLKWRRMYLDLLMAHRIQHGNENIRNKLFKLTAQVGPNLNLRRHHLTIYKSLFSTDIYKFHFVNRVVDHWNSLPCYLLDIVNFKSFKKSLKIHLLSNYNPFDLQV